MKKIQRVFVNKTKDIFRDVRDSFGMKKVEEFGDLYGVYVRYQNKTTSFKVEYDYREHLIRSSICRLVEGALPKHPIFIYDDTDLHCFDMQDLARMVGGVNIPYEVEETTKSIAHVVEANKEALLKFGSDILLGDFSKFGALEQVVKNRARDFRARQGT